jgi:hypothetical protein
MKPMSLIEEILKLRTNLGSNCKKLKSKDHYVNGATM